MKQQNRFQTTFSPGSNRFSPNLDNLVIEWELKLYIKIRGCVNELFNITKSKRMIILYSVPISLWPMLGKENRYFYTRHPNNNDRCKNCKMHGWIFKYHNILDLLLYIDNCPYKGKWFMGSGRISFYCTIQCIRLDIESKYLQ